MQTMLEGVQTVSDVLHAFALIVTQFLWRAKRQAFVDDRIRSRFPWRRKDHFVRQAGQAAPGGCDTGAISGNSHRPEPGIAADGISSFGRVQLTQ